MASYSGKSSGANKVTSITYFAKPMDRVCEIKPYRPKEREKESARYVIPRTRSYGPHSLRVYPQPQNDFPNYRLASRIVKYEGEGSNSRPYGSGQISYGLQRGY